VDEIISSRCTYSSTQDKVKRKGRPLEEVWVDEMELPKAAIRKYKRSKGIFLTAADYTDDDSRQNSPSKQRSQESIPSEPPTPLRGHPASGICSRSRHTTQPAINSIPLTDRSTYAPHS
jgi:hypothetical protein